jgi:hypothetical protein
MTIASLWDRLLGSTDTRQNWMLFAALLTAMGLLWGSGLLFAQIEGPERGVPPVASTGDFEVSGIVIDVSGDDAFDARAKGWAEAQRRGWQMLYARTHGGAKSGLGDDTLNGIVSAIIVEREEIGPKRYRATLGVLFDRARAGQLLGVGARQLRSPPLLVMPVQWTGGASIVFEQQTAWQRAWAAANFGDSPIDYVRPYGTDAESVVLNAGQAQRRNRQWWRIILEQFGAADVVIPIARLEHAYPGGPITGHFSARFGPDNRYLGSFTLRADDDDAVPAMLAQAVQRIDQIYSAALSRGVLKSDASIFVDEGLDLETIEAEVAKEVAALEQAGTARADAGDAAASSTAPNTPVAAIANVVVQFDTPDSGAVGRGEASVRSVPGVSSANTTSLAIGGLSVMQVRFAGDLEALAGALRARGWQVQVGSGALRIRRPGQAAPPPSSPSPPESQGGGNGG